MRFSALQLTAAAGGRLVGADTEVDGVSIDTRALRGGELFVPIVAARDGHAFISDAVRAGVPCYLSSQGPMDVEATCIEVADTAAALLEIGRLARSRLPDRVIGVTGSVGKTTVKDLTAAALQPSFATLSSRRSFNNELGVPLTLAGAPDGTEAAVIEMGARGAGHIAALCTVARPTVAVITVIANAHTEMFGSLDGVARAKGELIETLPTSGSAVLNADDERVAAMAARTRAAVLTYSVTSERADLFAAGAALDPELRPTFRLASPWGTAEVRLAARGLHNVGNGLAAAGAALAAGASWDGVVAGLESAVVSPWRMELHRTDGGMVVLNDAYNANPTSTEAALQALAALPAPRKVAVLGVMAELGPLGPDEHRRIAAVARRLGVEVIAVGTDQYGMPAVADAGAALAALRRDGALGPGTAVLVKGSRVAGLEDLASALIKE